MEADTPVKVLSIAPYRFLPARFGGHKAVALFYRYLSRYVSLTCIATRNTVPDQPLPYTLLPVMGNSVFRYIDLFNFFRFRRYIRKTAATHVMTEHPYLGWLLYLFKCFCGVQLIVRSHNIESVRFKTIGKWWWPLMYAYEGWVYRRADIVFFITPEDRDYAVAHYKVKPGNALVVTYGVERNHFPHPEKKAAAQALLRSRYSIAADTAVLLFNGSFDYAPNRKALDLLLHHTLPLFRSFPFPFQLLICGKGIPPEWIQEAPENVLFLGFVADIQTCFLGASVFLNPIVEGGGIKTKLVEALSFGTPAVSFASGAIGIPDAVAGDELLRVNDSDIQAFVRGVREQLKRAGSVQLPDTFFRYFSWDAIARQAAAFLERKGN